MVYDKAKTRPAPDSTTGPLHWLKENLFSSIGNSIMTLVGIGLIFSIIPPLLEWGVFQADFHGTEKSQCVSDGACWIFISEKFKLFMYGFYPEDEVWRIDLTFILFFVVLIISFIKKLPYRMYLNIALSVIYPIVAYNLLLGDGMLGLEPVDTNEWGGLMLTVIAASIGIVASFPIGIVLALGRQSNMPIIKSFIVIFIEFTRGVPLITILFMASVILPLFFPEEIDFNKLLRALIGITMFQSVYLAEAVRGGLQAIPKGQYEAADSLGLGYWQKMLLVILPQALKISIPNIVGTFIALFKDTTLLLIIGLFDILAMVHLTGSDPDWIGFDTEGYVFVTIIFWVFCFSMSRVAKRLEVRLNTDHK